MRNKFRLGAVVVFLLAVASITVASTSSSSGNSGDRGKRSVEVIRVTGIFVEESVSDLGEPGDSLGDQLAFTQDLFRRGEKVGIAGVVCTLMRLEPRAGRCIASALRSCRRAKSRSRGSPPLPATKKVSRHSTSRSRAVPDGTRPPTAC